MEKNSATSNSILYLIYDGDCILCSNTATALKIQKAIGKLETINARTRHPLVIEAIAKGYDLNEGILVKLNDQYYYGAEALHFLALISSPSDLLNKLNGFIFKSKFLSHFFYPILKFIRNRLLWLRRIPPIHQTEAQTLIQLLYGKEAGVLPEILQKRYANRPYTNDSLLLEGNMTIHISKIFRILSPLFRLAGALVPYPAKNIPVTVEFTSNTASNIIRMHRTFYYPDKKEYHFTSRVIPIKGNALIELMRFGVASKLIYRFKNETIFMDYGGYVFRLNKCLIPLPLSFLIGKFSAFEKAEANECFSMDVTMRHFLFGKIFQYEGQFKIADSHD